MLVNMGIFPKYKEVKIKDVWNHHLDNHFMVNIRICTSSPNDKSLAPRFTSDLVDSGPYFLTLRTGRCCGWQWKMLKTTSAKEVIFIWYVFFRSDNWDYLLAWNNDIQPKCSQNVFQIFYKQQKYPKASILPIQLFLTVFLLQTFQLWISCLGQQNPFPQKKICLKKPKGGYKLHIARLPSALGFLSLPSGTSPELPILRYVDSSAKHKISPFHIHRESKSWK